jgi:hypothetical protein
VSVVNISAVGVTVVPILPMLVGSGRTKGLLSATTRITKPQGWLLWDTTAAVLTDTIAFVAVVERALLLSGGVDASWGLLINGHAELLNVCKLGLHCNQAVGLVFDGFLHGSIHGTKVCKQVTIQHNQCVVIHGSHTISMLQGRDSPLVDECNRVGPIFFEGVNCLDDQWDPVFVQDPIFVLLGVHSTVLDDAQADVDYVAFVHWVACSACVGSANEEVRCKGLETFGGMPGGGHSLLIFLALFGHPSPVLHDEPIEHVEKGNVWLFHADWLVCFTNCFW